MSAAPSLCCPLCSAAVSPSSLEAHVRLELSLPLLKCALCARLFCDAASGEAHFRGEFAEHPDAPPQLIRTLEEPSETARLSELLRLARGGPEAVQERLCVCGHCRLLCREDFDGYQEAEAEQEERHRDLRHQPLQTDSAEADEAKDDKSFEAEKQPSQSKPIGFSRPSGAGQSQTDPNPQQWTEEAPPYYPSAKKWAEEAPPNYPSAKKCPEEAPQPDHNTEEWTEEEAPSRDVKPSLADLKAAAAPDGKVACLQCSHRADRSNFSNHVLSKHIPGNHYQCLLCPLGARQRSGLAKHQQSVHGVELSAETSRRTVPRDAVQEWIVLCFGEAKGAGVKEVRCRPCDKAVALPELKQHVASAHLKKPLHRCRQCGWSVNGVKLSHMNVHVRKVHDARPGPETVDSSAMDHYAPIIKAMIPKLFGL